MSKDSWSTTVDGIKLIINGGIDAAYGKMIAGSLIVPIRDKIANTGYLKVTQIEVTLEQQKPLNKSEQLLKALAKAGIKTHDGKIRLADVGAVTDVVLALDKSVTDELTPQLEGKDAKEQQTLVDKFAEDEGLSKPDDLSDLMYDLEKAGYPNLKKPKPSAAKPAAKPAASPNSLTAKDKERLASLISRTSSGSIRKPIDWQDIMNRTSPATEVDNLDAASWESVRKLPIYNLNNIDIFGKHALTAGTPQYFVAHNGGQAILVDTQGYDYARYVLVFSKAKFGIQTGANYGLIMV